MRGTWVSASKDFHYDEGAVGEVKFGQIFQLQGHINDERLVKHRLLIVLEPQPKGEKALTDSPRCGECGRIFLEDFQRDNCGMSHERTPEELQQAKVEKVAKTYEERVLTVGE